MNVLKIVLFLLALAALNVVAYFVPDFASFTDNISFIVGAVFGAFLVTMGKSTEELEGGL